MSFQKAAVGVTQATFRLERKRELWHDGYTIEALQWASDEICYYFSLPLVKVSGSTRLGRRRVGNLVTFGTCSKTGIRLGIGMGRSLAVLVHELAHWRVYQQSGSFAHNKFFRNVHYAMVVEVGYWNVFTLEELLKQNLQTWTKRYMPAVWELHSNKTEEQLWKIVQPFIGPSVRTSFS